MKKTQKLDKLNKRAKVIMSQCRVVLLWKFKLSILYVLQDLYFSEGFGKLICHYENVKWRYLTRYHIIKYNNYETLVNDLRSMRHMLVF